MEVYRAYESDLLGYSSKVKYFKNQSKAIEYAESLLKKTANFKITDDYKIFGDEIDLLPKERVFGKNCFLKNEDSVNFLADSFMVYVDKIEVGDVAGTKSEICEMLHLADGGGEDLLLTGSKKNLNSRFLEKLGLFVQKLQIAKKEDLDCSDYKDAKQPVEVFDDLGKGVLKLAKIRHFLQVNSEYNEWDIKEDQIILRKCELVS